MTQRNSVAYGAGRKAPEMYTASSIAKKLGTTVRTIQYYDKIGLFSPVDKTDTGYRLYNDDSVDRLKEILLYREAGYSLKDIKALLNADDLQREEIMTCHRERLEKQISDCREMIFISDCIKKYGIKFCVESQINIQKIPEEKNEE